MADNKVRPFTERTREVLRAAQKEAVSLGHPRIDIVHLVLGVLRVKDSLAARILANLHVDPENLYNILRGMVREGNGPTMTEMNFTLEAHHVIGLAVDEARRLGHTYIGTEHLLAGIVRSSDTSIAAGVLDLSLEKVREELERILNPSSRSADDGFKKRLAAALAPLEELWREYTATCAALDNLTVGQPDVAKALLEQLAALRRKTAEILAPELVEKLFPPRPAERPN